MRTLTKWVPIFLISSLFLVACNNKNEANDNAQSTENAKVNELAGDGKSLVGGCSGTGYTYGGAIDALKAGNYTESDRQASCVFNASVKVDAKHPDLKAANVALISKFILITESSQLRDLLFAPELKASDIFGPTGDVKKADATVKNAFGDGKGYEQAYKFFKAHEDQGKNPQAVIETAISLVRERGGDLHILAKAMAADETFSDILPSYLVKTSDAKDYTISQVEAATLDFDINVIRFFAEIASHYDFGLSSASVFSGASDLVIAQQIVNDLNSAPKFFTLKGAADANNAIPVFTDALDSGLIAVDSLSKKDLQSWAGDLPELLNLPTKGKTDDTQKVQLILLQVQQSLNSGEWVHLTAITDDVTSINAKAFFAKLPDAKNFTGDVVQLDGDEVELKDEFVQDAIKDFIKQE